MQVHQWKVRRPVTVVPQTAMSLLVCLMTVCFTTILALVNSSWAEYKGCERKEPKDLSSVRPVDISNKPANVEVIASKYCRTSEDSHLYYHQETVVAMPLTSLICKVHLEINQEEEREDDFYVLSEKDTCIVTEFLQSVETQQRASATPRQRNARSLAVDLEDDGRRVDTVPTSSGRLSRRVSFLTF